MLRNNLNYLSEFRPPGSGLGLDVSGPAGLGLFEMSHCPLIPNNKSILIDLISFLENEIGMVLTMVVMCLKLVLTQATALTMTLS